MPKGEIRFRECEHEGDLRRYTDALHDCGATVLNYDLDDEGETATVQIEVDDVDVFMSAFTKTEAFELSNLC